MVDRLWTWIAAAGLALTLLGCIEAEDNGARSAWLQNTLIEDNQHLLEREPVLTGGKFTKMAHTPYNHFRGTQPQFLRDMTAPGLGHAPTAFADAPSSRVRLVGDPHIENIGTYKNADNNLVVDYNDFDASTFGPWVFDVRRLALSAWMLGTTAQIDADALAAQVAQGYLTEIQAMADGDPGIQIRRGAGFGAALEDLMRRAARDGGSELDDYTRAETTSRRMFFGTIKARLDPLVAEDEVLEPSASELEVVRSALRRYPKTLLAPMPARFFQLKGVSKRLGAGVSSYPVLRFYALIEGPGPRIEDDVLLEFKEVGNAGALPGLRLFPDQIADNNGERVVEAQRALQEGVRNDPFLGWATVGPIAFRIRQRTGHQKGLSVERLVADLASGDLVEADLMALAMLAGRLLARSHAGARTQTGREGLAVIAAVLLGRGEAFVVEISDFVAAYGPRTWQDHGLLEALIEAEGPTLGYRTGVGR